MNSAHGSSQMQMLARRYACAYLNVFYEILSPESADAICEGAKFFSERKKALFFMQLGCLERSDVYDRLVDTCGKIGIPSTFNSLIALLLEHKRAFLLKQIFDELCNEVHRRRNELICEVAIAGQISESDKIVVTDFFQKKTGKKLICSYKEDPSLLAGIRIHSEQFLWESSIRGKLRRVYNALKR